MARLSLVSQGLLIVEDNITLINTPHSVALLWTSDQPDAETFTKQHKTLTRDRYPGGIRTHNPSKRTPADPRHRARDHWD